jgi:uncharacterized protein YegP (UPF0339 family)
MVFQTYKDGQHLWRWRLKSVTTDQIIAESPEGYYNEQECLDSIGHVMDTTSRTPVYRS